MAKIEALLHCEHTKLSVSARKTSFNWKQLILYRIIRSYFGSLARAQWLPSIQFVQCKNISTNIFTHSMFRALRRTAVGVFINESRRNGAMKISEEKRNENQIACQTHII